MSNCLICNSENNVLKTIIGLNITPIEYDESKLKYLTMKDKYFYVCQECLDNNYFEFVLRKPSKEVS